MFSFIVSKLRRQDVTRFSAIAAIVISLAALTGWALNLHTFRALIPNNPEMKPNTAAAFVIFGIGLLSATTSKAIRLRYAISVTCGVLVFLIGSLSLGEYVFAFDAGIDSILMPSLPSDATNNFALRIATFASFNFAIVGIALVTLTGSRRVRKLSEYLSFLSITASFAALLGYLFGAEYLYGMAGSRGVTPYAVVLFIMLAFGLLAANFGSRTVKLLLSDTLGGSAARRLLPAVIIIPTLLGWLRIVGQNYGLYDTGFGTALSMFSSVALMVALIFYYSETVHKVDIRRVAAEKELTNNELRYRNLFDHSLGLICTHDLDGTITSINPAALNSLGFAKSEVVGKNLGELIPPGGRMQLNGYLRQVEHEGVSQGLLSLVSKTGQALIWRYHNILISEEDREPYILGHAQDVSELLEIQQALKNLALTDDLTGLYNRRGFQTLAKQQLKLERHEGTARGIVLMFADLDGLKQINDLYGHHAGSEAIVAFSEVLKSALRNADLIGRWGGDEFVILTIGSPDESAEMIIERIHERLREHNSRSEAPYDLACSIGVAPCLPEDGRTFDSIVAEADKAMYREKQLRKAAIAVS